MQIVTKMQERPHKRKDKYYKTTWGIITEA